MAELDGKTLGPYRIIERIGRGGMATVYKAYHPAMNRHVAIKILPEEYATDPDFRTRFEREAQVVANLRHPYILPVFDYGEDAGISYLVMPYIPSGTLKTFLVENGPLDYDTIIRIGSNVADALDYAHQQGIIHRDVKPDNVLFDERGNPLLSDFGLTRMMEGGGSLTGTGVIGTPMYMSPEQGQGKPIDHRSDLYSLGIILYEMVTGSVPFSADTPVAIIFKHVADPLPMPRSRRPDLPEGAQEVLLKALAKEPEDRWQTCMAMMNAFEQAIKSISQPDATPIMPESSDEGTVIGLQPQTTPIADSQTEFLPKTTPSVKRNQGGLALLVLVIVATIAGIALLSSGGDDNVDDTDNAGIVPTTAVAQNAMMTDIPSETPEPTTAPTITLTNTPDVVEAAQQVIAQQTAQAIIEEASATSARTTQNSANATTTATLWTKTPTPDLTATIDGLLTLWAEATAIQASFNGTATATLWTKTPTPTQTHTATHTPTHTATNTATATPTPSYTPTITPTLTPSDTPAPSPTPTATLPPDVEAAVQRAYNFEGSRNSDWQPFEHDFDGVTMVLVPAGCFMMGSDSGDSDEQPVHEQCFDKPFWLDKYEVDNERFAEFITSVGNIDYRNYNAFLDSEIYYESGGVWLANASYVDYPANAVTWWGARDYCFSQGGQLPTEAQWEYAARGIESWVFPWGNTYIGTAFVNLDNSGGRTNAVWVRPGGTSWVGAFNMIGNVYEWTSSQRRDYPYNAEDGRERDGNSSVVLRASRGYAWNTSFNYPISATDRFFREPEETDKQGFRCARSVD
jgi:serine/threonine protein kinase